MEFLIADALRVSREVDSDLELKVYLLFETRC